MIRESLGTQPRRGAYIFVNNRLEENAPITIFSMMERAGAYEPPDRIKFTVKTTFGTLAQNRRFIFRGREYLKIAQSMSQDMENNSAIFMAETEVEAEDPG